MVSFKTLDEAKEYGNKVSAERLKVISIYHNFKTNQYEIFLTEEMFKKFYKGIHSHNHAYLCSNFETPYSIGYKLFKNKANRCVVDQYPTIEMRNNE